MKLKKLNNAVSMYESPALGDINPKTRFMALSVDKSTINKKTKYGLAREITVRTDSPDNPGNIDLSKLIIIKSNNLINWKKVTDLKIKGIKEIIKKIFPKNSFFLGLEDPDIIIDEKGIKHVYFTIAFKIKNTKRFAIFLGHAKGKSLENLTATMPVLSPKLKNNKIQPGFKELALSPIIINNEKYVLNEYYLGKALSVSISKFTDYNKRWKFIKEILIPNKIKRSWANYELSPCKFFHPDFITHKINDKNYLVGIMNGKENPIIIINKKIFGKFRPGLFLFDPGNLEIPWLSPKPLLEDPVATTITFASDFIQTSSNSGILYAHPNDSFVRSYKINKKELIKLLPKKL